MTDLNASQYPLSSFNGSIVPGDRLSIPVYDLGFVHAASVVETLRTFRQELFLPEKHWERLQNSMSALGIQQDGLITQIHEHAKKITSHNATLLQPDEELGLIAFVSAGPNLGYLSGVTGIELRPTVGIHTFRVPFEMWYEEWERGQDIYVSSISSMPESVIPATIKYRSRLHWYLADKDVAKKHKGGRAVLADEQGNLTETSSGNIFAVRGRKLITPPVSSTLPGISQFFVSQLAKELGLEFVENKLSILDLIHSDEAFVSSTSWCIMPIRSINGESVQQGGVWKELLNLWSMKVNVDIAAQIKSLGKKQSLSKG